MDDPVRSERSGSKRWGVVVGLLLLGLVLGGFVGGLIGGILGAHRADAAAAAYECYFAGCGYFLEYVFFGVLLGAILGAIFGGLVGVRMRRKPTPPSASGRLEPAPPEVFDVVLVSVGPKPRKVARTINTFNDRTKRDIESDLAVLPNTILSGVSYATAQGAVEELTHEGAIVEMRSA